jgi:hypothetical protein
VWLIHGERGKVDKCPALEGWQQATTRDEAAIRRWWGGNFAACAVGVGGGKFGDGERSLLVLDADDTRST